MTPDELWEKKEKDRQKKAKRDQRDQIREDAQYAFPVSDIYGYFAKNPREMKDMKTICGIYHDDFEDVINTLDYENDGELNLDEFMGGLMRISG
jgi:hypothetical protein